ncbi:MAG: hypothetical protein RLZZ450_7109 [Pseudomonadota bacterium]|jgi:hypothetical protein
MEHTMSPMSRSLWVSLLSAAFFAVFLWIDDSAVRAEGAGLVGCQVLDNGSRAAASFRVLRDGAQISAGTCGKDLEVPEGAYELVVVLDGVLGESEQRVLVTARAGAAEHPTVRFETGELLIEVTREGRRSTALVQLSAGGRKLAQLSAGVATRLAVGTYSLEVESRGEKRQLAAVTIVRGERRVLGVEFGAPPK